MKVWTCICGSKEFELTRSEIIIVDFGREGAIGGHPHIGKGCSGPQVISCSRCDTKVPDEIASRMLKEII